MKEKWISCIHKLECDLYINRFICLSHVGFRDCIFRRVHQYGAEIIGGLHLKMPDSIGDEKVLKRPLEKNKQLIGKAESKIRKAFQLLKSGNPTHEGLGVFGRMAGFLIQRLLFGYKTKC